MTDEPLLGRYEAAALLAVDAANGGTLAGIEEIVATFERLFHRQPTAAQSAASFALLCEAGLVEYSESELGLTRHGRKLLRHAGLPGSPDRPRRVAELLGEVEDGDLASPGSVPSPSEHDVSAALSNLEADGGADLSPRTRGAASLPVIGVPLAPGGSQVDPMVGRRLMFHQASGTVPAIPMVQPGDDADDADYDEHDADDAADADYDEHDDAADYDSE